MSTYPHPSEMEESPSNQNNWPFSVRYTASPYRSKIHNGKGSPGGVAPPVIPPHAHTPTTPATSATAAGSIGSPHYPPDCDPRYFPHPSQFKHHFAGAYQNGGALSPVNANHFLDLKTHQEQQQHLIHYRQRQYDHHNYGLPLSALPPQVILQASQATLNKTMSFDLKQSFEHFHQQQEFQQQQQQQQPLLECKRGGMKDNAAHFRMRYPPIKTRNRVIKLNGNLEQIEGLDEGYIEELKVDPSPTGGGNYHPHFLPCDPYSYVYDASQVVKEDLSVCSASVNTFLTQNHNHNVYAIHPQSTRPHLHPHPHPHLHPPEGYFHQHSGGCGSSSHPLENEYEEICDVQKYMNIVVPPVEGELLLADKRVSIDKKEELQLSSSPLTPKHFKSYSTSTDDVLAEVVQVQQKRDRVLDQLNLEVENLLMREVDGAGGSYGDLFVSKEEGGTTLAPPTSAPPPLAPPSSSSSSLNPAATFATLTRRSNTSSPNVCAISSFGTFGRRSKQEGCCVMGSNSLKKQGSLGKMKEVEVEGICGSKEGFSGKPPKMKYHRSMSLIPNWKIRDHLMRLPFLRNHDKVKKSEGSLPHSHSISGGDFSTLQQKSTSTSITMSSVLGEQQQQQKQLTPSSLKARSSSVDELRTTGAGEEHWYSADSDTEPDSLTAAAAAAAPQPPSHSPPGAQDHQDHLKRSNVRPVYNGDCAVNSVNLNFKEKFGNGSVNVNGGNIYSNFTSNCNGSRMDVVAATISGIPELPKPPKFRRPASGLKEKWRESWSSSSSSSNAKNLLKSTSMEEENRLLRWFSLRKNSATFTNEGGGNGNGGALGHNGASRHSTLPQLSEEDLKRISFMEDEEGYWPRRTVQPPALPPPPPDLHGDQITRRHIVAAIVHSENSYVAALQRLVNEYKKPLERSHPAILSHSKISSIFHRVPEILQCHSLFRIALAECVRKWDTDEKIGDVFVASFSKTLVLDVYSEFINNFGTAMETAKAEARRKSSFAEFLKVKQITAHDRLSLFGLMVKPVQRFPQFILLLQDLLKHTPKEHHDRMSLQLALTQLESLAAMLNERKRESEQYQAFRETIKSIGGGKFVLLRSIVDDPNRILLRQDLVTQLEFDSYGSTVAKSKVRKLLLLNDMLICTTVTGGSGGGSSEHGGASSSTGAAPFSRKEGHGEDGRRKVEKNVFKWSYAVRDVEVEDISISPTMSRFVHSKSSTNLKSSSGSGNTQTEESSMSITLLEEMQAFMHDYEVLSRILSHVSTLKSSYEGLSISSVKELMLEIQHQIRCRDEQISYFDSSCLTLLLGSGSHKEKLIFQMQSPAARSAWIEELRLAQLALDPNNSPAWDIPLESPYPLHKLPLFVKALPLSKQPHLTVVKCGCFFTHTFVSQTGRSKILDYLWVSSTDGMSSHLTAYRSQQNVLKEVSSLDLVEEKVNDMLFVQGYIWVGTESRKIMIFDPADTEKGPIAQQVLTDSVLKLLHYNDTIFAGLGDGHLAIFVQLLELEDPDKLQPEILLQLGAERIVSLFGSREHVYAACGSAIVTVNATTYTIEKSVILNQHNGPISHMACSGVGLWITTQESETVCLYHLESFQHLQDVSIRPSVYRTVRDSFRRSKGVHVSCLIAHKGWLWIGTNLGVVLTIPLPRLEGVPIISTGNANVSFHGFCGPVTFLLPLMRAAAAAAAAPSLLSSQSKTRQPKPTKDKDNQAAAAASKKKAMEEESSPKTVTKDSGSSFSSPESTGSPPQDQDHNTCTSSPPEPTAATATATTPLTIDVDIPDKAQAKITPPSNGVVLRNRKRKSLPSSTTNNISSSSSSSIEAGAAAHSPIGPGGGAKTLVVLRKKSSKESMTNIRACKTLPRGGPLPSNLRFSIDSDVYGLYGNLINVRGLEDEGRFVDPLYDALRRSDPELNSLDAKISTMDRRLRMRMSRPRSLDLSNWSVDSKISASSDDSSVGVKSGSGIDFSLHHLLQSEDSSPTPPTNEIDSGVSSGKESLEHPGTITSSTSASTATASANTIATPTTTTTGRKSRQKGKGAVAHQERTVLVVVGGRGYLNSRALSQEHFISNTDSETKSCPHLTLWQMKT